MICADEVQTEMRVEVQKDLDPADGLVTPAEDSYWYAVRTRSRHEKVVATQFDQLGIENFLPQTTEVRKWSDRKKLVELPLFPGYTFVRLVPSSGSRLRVLQTHGVAGFVGTPSLGMVPIPDQQIEDIRTVLAAKVAVRQHPYLQIGQRVRVRGGALDGMEGILVSQSGDQSLVIAVEPIQRSMSIRVEGYTVEPV